MASSATAKRLARSAYAYIEAARRSGAAQHHTLRALSSATVHPLLESTTSFSSAKKIHFGVRVSLRGNTLYLMKALLEQKDCFARRILPRLEEKEKGEGEGEGERRKFKLLSVLGLVALWPCGLLAVEEKRKEKSWTARALN